MAPKAIRACKYHGRVRIVRSADNQSQREPRGLLEAVKVKAKDSWILSPQIDFPNPSGLRRYYGDGPV